MTNIQRSKLFEALINNKDGDRPHLWLTKDNLGINFEDLLFALKRKKSLKEISVYNTFSDFSNRELNRMYKAVAVKPKLERFSIWSYKTLPVSMVVVFLKRARNIKAVAFNNVLIRDDHQAASLAEAILSHASVETIAIDNIKTPGLALGSLFESVVSSGLKSFRISLSEGCRAVADSSSIANLCTSPNLEHLYLWGIGLDDEVFARMGQGLATSNTGRLDSLSLRHCGHCVTEKSYSALVEMLKSNFRIVKLHLDKDVPPTLQEAIDFYLNINRSGIRRYLLVDDFNSSKEDWIELLNRHSNDVATLYYLLRESGSTLWGH